MTDHAAIFNARMADFTQAEKTVRLMPKARQREELIEDSRKVMDYVRKASAFVSDLWNYGQRVFGPDFTESDTAQRARVIVVDLAGRFVSYQAYRMHCYAQGKTVPPLPAIPGSIVLPGATVIMALLPNAGE